MAEAPNDVDPIGDLYTPTGEDGPLEEAALAAFAAEEGPPELIEGEAYLFTGYDAEGSVQSSFAWVAERISVGAEVFARPCFLFSDDLYWDWWASSPGQRVGITTRLLIHVCRHSECDVMAPRGCSELIHITDARPLRAEGARAGRAAAEASPLDDLCGPGPAAGPAAARHTALRGKLQQDELIDFEKDEDADARRGMQELLTALVKEFQSAARSSDEASDGVAAADGDLLPKSLASRRARCRKLALERPGRFARMSLAQMAEYLGSQHPVKEIGGEIYREKWTIAEALDLVLQGRAAAVTDILAQRFKAIQAAVNDGDWSAAKWLELTPPRDQPLALRSEEEEMIRGTQHGELELEELASRLRRTLQG
ncbi:unnamed protein product [Prorocentrum cordatum]|uniref:Uncharacterized protein n=1 Tax=Prorocentrum cordatum TaxID=2364126 RepID=A0ABN9TJU0_9DINO|nr:unnamed protein product [Polarella glacialis]